MIPGGNIFAQAMTAIASQGVQYYANTGRTTNAIGYDVATYAAPVTILCSVQPIPRSLYEHMGLDFSKSYVTIYTTQAAVGVERGGAGDKLSFAGHDYQCLSITAWGAVDGWNELLCVAVS